MGDETTTTTTVERGGSMAAQKAAAADVGNDGDAAEQRASEIIALGRALIEAVRRTTSSRSRSGLASVRTLIEEQGAPTWYQDEAQGGWGALHFAAASAAAAVGGGGGGQREGGGGWDGEEEDGEEDVVRVLLEQGAVWNAVDHLGLTPGDIALSVNDRRSFELIRNEGLRQEILHHAMASARRADADVDVASSSAAAVDPESVLATTTSSGLTLRHSDTTSSGSNAAFLASQLVWSHGDDGKERVLDADGNGVMMGWEEPLMVRHVEAMTKGWGKVQEGPTVLNVGYGLGIIDRLFQQRSPALHVVIEAHPQVLGHMRDTGFDRLPGVVVLPGRWQDYVEDEDKLHGELIALTPDSCGFDAIFVDTFAEGYEDLKAFFDHLPDLLEPTQGVFSWWNGLGATSATIYDVASELAAFHLEDVGAKVEWEDVEVGDIEETWQGVRRKYWDLPLYRLPVARMSM